MCALHHAVSPRITDVMPRSARNAVCSLKSTSPTRKCIASAPNVKRNRGCQIRNANIVVTGSTVRPVVTKFLRPVCLPVRGVPPVYVKWRIVNLKAPANWPGLFLLLVESFCLIHWFILFLPHGEVAATRQSGFNPHLRQNPAIQYIPTGQNAGKKQ